MESWRPDALISGIFGAYAKGSSANANAYGLNDAGIAMPRRRSWKGQAIGKMLDNPAYTGLSLVDDDFVAAQWEAIVDRATWDAVR